MGGMDGGGKPIIPAPNLRASIRIEITMIGVMLLAWALFLVFNPLRMSN
jgi:hypothetical protein